MRLSSINQRSAAVSTRRLVPGTVCAIVVVYGMLCQGGVLIAQTAPGAKAAQVSQRPVINGLATGYEKVVAVTEDRPPYKNLLPRFPAL